MAVAARPRRSLLYMPGSNARALDKGRSLPADGLILDLEDAVAPDTKAVARTQTVEAVRQGGYGGRELLIRVNGLDTEWGEADMAAVATAGADGVLLPKVDDADAVHRAERMLSKAGAPDDLALWCMMETPLGILNAAAIAGASPRLGGMVMGTSDLAKDLHASHTVERLPMITALGLCVLAARAYGLAIIDGVHLDLEDADGFAAVCRQGVDMGFDGKSLIHPKQVEAANRAFAPSADEIAYSRKIIDAHAAAAAEGKGVVVVDGRLVENLHVDNARRLVALSEAIDSMAAETR